MDKLSLSWIVVETSNSFLFWVFCQKRNLIKINLLTSVVLFASHLFWFLRRLKKHNILMEISRYLALYRVLLIVKVLPEVFGDFVFRVETMKYISVNATSNGFHCHTVINSYLHCWHINDALPCLDNQSNWSYTVTIIQYVQFASQYHIPCPRTEARDNSTHIFHGFWL